jgi:hypothetical protein
MGVWDVRLWRPTSRVLPLGLRRWHYVPCPELSRRDSVEVEGLWESQRTLILLKDPSADGCLELQFAAAFVAQGRCASAEGF